jgi:hypothetical protein
MGRQGGGTTVDPASLAGVNVAALRLPARATVSEIEIRPTDPPVA